MEDKLAHWRISLTKWSVEWRGSFQSFCPKSFIPQCILGMKHILKACFIIELTSLIIWLEMKLHRWFYLSKPSPPRPGNKWLSPFCYPWGKTNPKMMRGPINRLKKTVKCGKNPDRKVQKLIYFGWVHSFNWQFEPILSIKNVLKASQ